MHAWLIAAPCSAVLASSSPPQGTWHAGGVWKADSHCSEIRCSADGRFLYVGNRGHDSIAIFAIDQATGALARTACVPSGGEYPRNFNFSVSGGECSTHCAAPVVGVRFWRCFRAAANRMLTLPL
jgi:hypothetical protein